MCCRCLPWRAAATKGRGECSQESPQSDDVQPASLSSSLWPANRTSPPVATTDEDNEEDRRGRSQRSGDATAAAVRRQRASERWPCM